MRLMVAADLDVDHSPHRLEFRNNIMVELTETAIQLLVLILQVHIWKHRKYFIPVAFTLAQYPFTLSLLPTPPIPLLPHPHPTPLPSTPLSLAHSLLHIHKRAHIHTNTYTCTHIHANILSLSLSLSLSRSHSLSFLNKKYKCKRFKIK